jgi:hypothetical protein
MLSDSRDLPDNSHGFSITGMLFKANRGPFRQSPHLAEEPKPLELRTDHSAAEVLSATEETYDRTEMMYAISTLGKIATAAYQGEFVSDIEPKVSMALNLHLIDLKFPAKPEV